MAIDKSKKTASMGHNQAQWGFLSAATLIYKFLTAVRIV